MQWKVRVKTMPVKRIDVSKLNEEEQDILLAGLEYRKSNDGRYAYVNFPR